MNLSQDARRKHFERPHYERLYCGDCLMERVAIVKLNSDGSCPYESLHQPLETADMPDARRDGAE